MPFDLALDEVQPLLNTVRDVFSQQTATEILLIAADQVGLAAEEVAPGGRRNPYPPQTHNPLPLFYERTNAKGETYRSKFKSLRQQRKVMALINEGAIPYRRTGTLGKSFTHSVPHVVGPGVVQVEVGTKLAYAPYVVDIDVQSHYHLGNWKTLQADLYGALNDLSIVAMRAVLKEVNRRLNHG